MVRQREKRGIKESERRKERSSNKKRERKKESWALSDGELGDSAREEKELLMRPRDNANAVVLSFLFLKVVRIYDS